MSLTRDPARARVYAALHRRPQLAGLPQEVFLIMALGLTSMAVASRLDLRVLVACTTLYLGLLPLLRRLFERDPYLMDILPRALRYEARYPRQSKEAPHSWRDRIPARTWSR